MEWNGMEWGTDVWDCPTATALKRERERERRGRRRWHTMLYMMMMLQSWCRCSATAAACCHEVKRVVARIFSLSTTWWRMTSSNLSFSLSPLFFRFFLASSSSCSSSFYSHWPMLLLLLSPRQLMPQRRAQNNSLSLQTAVWIDQCLFNFNGPILSSIPNRERNNDKQMLLSRPFFNWLSAWKRWGCWGEGRGVQGSGINTYSKRAQSRGVVLFCCCSVDRDDNVLLVSFLFFSLE